MHKTTLERRLPGAGSSMSTPSHEGADNFRPSSPDKMPEKGNHTSSTMASALRTWSAENLQTSSDVDCLGMSFTARRRTSLQVLTLFHIQLGPFCLAVWKTAHSKPIIKKQDSTHAKAIVDRGQAVFFTAIHFIWKSLRFGLVNVLLPHLIHLKQKLRCCCAPAAIWSLSCPPLVVFTDIHTKGIEQNLI